jgi:hypothetical protein
MSRLLDCDYGSRWRRMARDPATLTALFASSGTAAAAGGTAASVAGGSLAFAEAAAAGSAGLAAVAPAAGSASLFSSLASGIGSFFSNYGGLIAAGTGLAGAGVSAAGSSALARSQAKALEFQAAQYAADAAEADHIGRDNERALRREGSRLAASQRAALSASGVVPSRGTAMLLQDNLSDEIEREVATVRAGRIADVEKLYGMAALGRSSARGVRTQARYGSVSSLLEGGAKFGLRLTNPTGVA